MQKEQKFQRRKGRTEGKVSKKDSKQEGKRKKNNIHSSFQSFSSHIFLLKFSFSFFFSPLESTSYSKKKKDSISNATRWLLFSYF
ncbi:hypothetical protein STCU_10267 [Strigomonas culicis]|uniref:Uncharacterized protein n=1 Tax=Strigomonas culicis TaxID=28005 RepID=S9UTX3_9TRYP|nr:hypothetical protein STCU_10267 [Strigomonas culicis]|eukprot:EPY17996.1 hypothetical protein STCU_10267 [Strigomonas culicis]